MSKSNASQRIPRAKGIDMATVYSPKECGKKARHLILPDFNQRIVDEFDAIARTRGSNDEVKEMARTVNTLLLCLDDFGDKSIMMAATNLEKELDQAIWRRFDTKMTYSLPDFGRRQHYVEILLGDFRCEASALTEACDLLEGSSFADMEQIVLKAKRKAIIERQPLLRSHIKDSYDEYNPDLAKV